MCLASLMSERSCSLLLSTSTPPHTLHAYKLHAIIQFETFIFLEILRFEKQGETFFQLLRFVIPEKV